MHGIHRSTYYRWDVVWQYTAIDATSSFTWAELHVTLRNPDVRFSPRIAHRVARNLRDAGWELERIMTNGFVERFQQMILEKCWMLAFTRYLECYNYDRAHNGHLPKGRIPAQVLGPLRCGRSRQRCVAIS